MIGTAQHTLLEDGAPHNTDGTRSRTLLKSPNSGIGYGKCSCGQLSPSPLPAAGARQRWHAEHIVDTP